MILRQEKALPANQYAKEITRYAWFPTKLKRNPLDSTGEIIWLEKYISIYKLYQKNNRNKWCLDRSVRLAVYVLEKLEKTEYIYTTDEATQNSVGMAAPLGAYPKFRKI